MQSTWRKTCFTLYTLSLFDAMQAAQITTTTLFLTTLPPPHTAQQKTFIQKILLFRFQVDEYLTHFFITTTKSPSCLSSFPTLTPPPPLIFLSHPVLLVFCCVLVKSQLATVSRSLAALTMASGIMLNTAPRLLSPSTGVSNALWSTQERDGALSMKMSLQLHKHVSQTPSLSALPPLASPFPTFIKFLFDGLLKGSLISCSSFIMHAHFEFA